MSRKDDINKLIANYRSRLQKLKEQRALQGMDTPPHILAEIESIEVEVEKLQTELSELVDINIDTDPQRVFSSKRRTQIYLVGDYASLSADRWSAAIDAFAAVAEISPQAIEVYRVYRGGRAW